MFASATSIPDYRCANVDWLLSLLFWCL
jgi:hypothetical protein